MRILSLLNFCVLTRVLHSARGDYSTNQLSLGPSQGSEYTSFDAKNSMSKDSRTSQRKSPNTPPSHAPANEDYKYPSTGFRVYFPGMTLDQEKWGKEALSLMP